MSTILAVHRDRRAAKVHICDHCRRAIGVGTRYVDFRVVDDGHAFTFRAHTDCDDAYCSWQPDESYDLLDLSEGHLPPCPLAWFGLDGDTCACPPAPGPGQIALANGLVP